MGCNWVLGLEDDEPQAQSVAGNSSMGGSGGLDGSAGTPADEPPQAGASLDGGSSGASAGGPGAPAIAGAAGAQAGGGAAGTSGGEGGASEGGTLGGAPEEQAGNAGEGGAAEGITPPCTDGLAWQHVVQARNEERSISALQLAPAVGVIRDESGGARCLGVLLSNVSVLLVDCEGGAREHVAFDVRAATDLERDSPVQEFALDEWMIQVGRVKLVSTATPVDYWTRPAAAWSPRPVVPGERATLISHHGDGRARAAYIALDPDAFGDGLGPPSGQVAAVFGEDARLLGFCSHDCRGVHDCFDLGKLVPLSSELQRRASTTSLIWGDVNGDAISDPGVINLSAVGLLMFPGPNEELIQVSQTFQEEERFLLADVTGDGAADLLGLGSKTRIWASARKSFDSPTDWPIDVSAALALLTGDVDGDGRMNLVEHTDNDLYVRSWSPGAATPRALWLSGVGARTVQLADVTGDGLADAVLVGERVIEAAVSNGQVFGSPEPWAELERIGAPGLLLGDVDGDGRADALRVDGSGSKLYRAVNNGFVAWPGSEGTIVRVGARGNYLADVTGDGMADAIIHDHQEIVALPGSAHGFGSPVQIVSGPYYGGF